MLLLVQHPAPHDCAVGPACTLPPASKGYREETEGDGLQENFFIQEAKRIMQNF